MIETAEQLSHVVFENADFSGRDLRKCSLDHSQFINCDFSKANLHGVNCEHSNFSHSSFLDANLGYANFKDCNLIGVLWAPKDCYGTTITLQCQTFAGLRMSQLWWFGLLIFAGMAIPEKYPIVTRPGEPTLHDQLIAMIGAERYVKLRAMFQRREL